MATQNDIFDFAEWIRVQGFDEIKPIFEKHNLIKFEDLTLTNPKLHVMVSDPDMFGKHGTFIGKVLQAVGDLQKVVRNAEPVRYIVVSEQEDQTIEKLSTNAEKLQGIQKELQASHELFVSGLQASKAKQIETARYKINKVFDFICDELKSKQTKLMDQLRNMELDTIDVTEADDMLSDTLQQLNQEREALKQSIQECKQLIRSSTNNSAETKRLRKEKILACGTLANETFDQSHKALKQKVDECNTTMEQQLSDAPKLGFVYDDAALRLLKTKIEELGSIERNVPFDEDLYQEVGQMHDKANIAAGKAPSFQLTVNKNSTHPTVGETMAVKIALEAAIKEEEARNAAAASEEDGEEEVQIAGEVGGSSNGSVDGSNTTNVAGNTNTNTGTSTAVDSATPKGTLTKEETEDNRPICKYFGSAAGCPKPAGECAFSHANPNSVVLCRWYNSRYQAGCKYGNKCQFRHEVFECEAVQESAAQKAARQAMSALVKHQQAAKARLVAAQTAIMMTPQEPEPLKQQLQETEPEKEPEPEVEQEAEAEKAEESESGEEDNEEEAPAGAVQDGDMLLLD